MRSDYIQDWHILQQKTGMNIVDFFTLKYQEGLSCDEIAEMCKKDFGFHRTARSINRMLLRHGVRMRPIGDAFRNALKRGRIKHHWKKCSKEFKRSPISKKLRFTILTRDGFVCVLCGQKKLLEVDHIIPVTQGGTNSPENLQTLCHRCNVGKRDLNKENAPTCGFVSGAAL